MGGGGSKKSAKYPIINFDSLSSSFFFFLQQLLPPKSSLDLSCFATDPQADSDGELVTELQSVLNKFPEVLHAFETYQGSGELIRNVCLSHAHAHTHLKCLF